MQALKNSELDSVIKRLDSAIAHHRAWVRALMRSLCCQQVHNQNDMNVDAHNHCSFGIWYYGKHPLGLKKNQWFKAIEQHHINVHVWAACMLKSTAQNNAVSPSDFDQFSHHLDLFEAALNELKNEILELLYHRDPLTGAFDRAALSEELYQLTLDRKISHRNASIVMLDIDKFKLINDNYGHQMGDLVLKKISSFVLSQLRVGDKLFRFGGEEFIILLAETSVEEASTIAERIRDGLSKQKISDGHRTVSVTASFGVAKLESSNEISIEHADKALYQAKHSGRNGVVTYQ